MVARESTARVSPTMSHRLRPCAGRWFGHARGRLDGERKNTETKFQKDLFRELEVGPENLGLERWPPSRKPSLQVNPKQKWRRKLLSPFSSGTENFRLCHFRMARENFQVAIGVCQGRKYTVSRP